MYQLSDFYPQGDPLRASRGLKTNYMTYVDNFYTKWLILDLKVSLDRTIQDTNLCLKE